MKITKQKWKNDTQQVRYMKRRMEENELYHLKEDVKRIKEELGL